MKNIVFETIRDLHWGRHSWRVRLLLSLPALAAGFAVGLVH